MGGGEAVISMAHLVECVSCTYQQPPDLSCHSPLKCSGPVLVIISFLVKLWGNPKKQEIKQIEHPCSSKKNTLFDTSNSFLEICSRNVPKGNYQHEKCIFIDSRLISCDMKPVSWNIVVTPHFRPFKAGNRRQQGEGPSTALTPPNKPQPPPPDW